MSGQYKLFYTKSNPPLLNSLHIVRDGLQMIGLMVVLFPMGQSHTQKVKSMHPKLGRQVLEDSNESHAGSTITMQ